MQDRSCIDISGYSGNWKTFHNQAIIQFLPTVIAGTALVINRDVKENLYPIQWNL